MLGRLSKCVETPEKTPRMAKVVPSAVVLCRRPLAKNQGRTAPCVVAEPLLGRRKPHRAPAVATSSFESTHRNTVTMRAEQGRASGAGKTSGRRTLKAGFAVIGARLLRRGQKPSNETKTGPSSDSACAARSRSESEMLAEMLANTAPENALSRRGGFACHARD